MSDLQCPATVVFVADAAAASALPHSRFRVARVISPRGEESKGAAGAGESTGVRGLDGAGDLIRAVEDLADQYRGECVAVVAPRELVDQALSRVPGAGPPATSPDVPWLAVEVDSTGWRVLPTSV